MIPLLWRLQTAPCRAAERVTVPPCPAAHPFSFPFPDKPSLLPVQGSLLCICRGRADPGHGSFFSQVLGGCWMQFLLKKVKQFWHIRKSEMDFQYLKGREHFIQQTQRTLLVKASPPPWFPLQPELSWELSLTGTAQGPSLQPLRAPEPSQPPHPAQGCPSSTQKCFVAPAPAP